MQAFANYLLSFFFGIATAWFAGWLNKKRDKQKQIEEGKFKVYMLLLSLWSDYFWVTTAEMHKKQTSPEILQRIEYRKWKIADELRLLDDLPELEIILQSLFSKEFKTANEKYLRLNEVINSLGQSINPRYTAIMRKISDVNIKYLADPNNRIP